MGEIVLLPVVALVLVGLRVGLRAAARRPRLPLAKLRRGDLALGSRKVFRWVHGRGVCLLLRANRQKHGRAYRTEAGGEPNKGLVRAAYM